MGCLRITADDMGLGKTITMISLILASLAKKNLDDKYDETDGDDNDETWSNSRSFRAYMFVV